VVTLLLNNGVLQWLEAHMLTCPSKKWLHIDCPGCGLQRSAIALLKGDLINSFQLYPATLPILAILVFLVLHLKNQYKKGAFILQRLYVFCSIIVLIHYIYKIATHQIMG
jgi:Protein of unknown function (DUF2752)